ncbi:hypothetical protein [Streptomyces cathayae]|uniref:hypothetical protein n=1 Tax=Streptomyces cathayae TaxID=3031124 RepID=UPI003C6EE854
MTSPTSYGRSSGLSLSGVASYRAHVAIFYQERRHLTGEHLRAVTEKRDELEALICGIVQHGIDAGKFRSNVTSRIVAFGIIGMCASTFQWFNPDGTMSVDDVTDQFCTLVLDGLVV